MWKNLEMDLRSVITVITSVSFLLRSLVDFRFLKQPQSRVSRKILSATELDHGKTMVTKVVSELKFISNLRC